MASTPILNPTATRPPAASQAPVVAASLANRSVSLYAYSAVKKTWDAIIAVANFIFLELIPGFFYYLPRAIFYQLPLLINRLHTDLDKVEEVLKNERLHRVAANTLDVLDKATGLESADMRANVAVAVDRAARYVAHDEAAVDAVSVRQLMGAARAAVDEWNGHAVAGRSIWGRLFKSGSSSPAAGGAAGARPAAASEEEPIGSEAVEANVVVAMFQSVYAALTTMPRRTSVAAASSAAEASASAPAGGAPASRTRSPLFSLPSFRRTTSSAQLASGQLPATAALAAAPATPPRS